MKPRLRGVFTVQGFLFRYFMGSDGIEAIMVVLVGFSGSFFSGCSFSCHSRGMIYSLSFLQLNTVEPKTLDLLAHPHHFFSELYYLNVR